MKTILKAYKFRIYPTKIQEEYLCQVFGDVRFLWNKLVANFNLYGSIDFDKSLSEKELKSEFDFLKNSISYALQQKRIDFEQTKSQFFDKTRKSKIGRMQFKKKGKCADSFRIPGKQLSNLLNFKDNTITLTKLGKIKCKFDRNINGEIRNVTVSRTKTNKYYASVLIIEEIKNKEKTNRVVGIDLGLKDLMILSDNIKIDNLRWFRKSQSKLAKAQRHLSRKNKDSNRYSKQKFKVAKIHETISNQRSWFTHNLTTLLINTYDIICLEDLNIEGMKKLFGKSLSDANLSEICRQLKYKADWYGKTIYQIDRFFPSSKTCSVCGNIKSNLTLSDRIWVCNCGAIHDRDLNASYNILREGLKLSKSGEVTDYKCGGEIRLELVHPNLASSMKRLNINKEIINGL